MLSGNLNIGRHHAHSACPLHLQWRYTFNGADVSHFSGKVRPAFPHKSLWVREVMPDILAIKEKTGSNFS